MVWLAPVPRSFSGLSALIMANGTPVWYASMTAGTYSPSAVPEVHTSPTGRPDAFAMPSAVNPAVRSSTRTCATIAPAVSAAATAYASGALREPGERMMWRIPARMSESSTEMALSIESGVRFSVT